jgi:rRNA biogenesis protein RRP5
MKSLSRHKHIEVLTKFALMAFDLKKQDAARAVFESLLETYPKRVDLWHVYVDREMKLGHIPEARHLFERLITLKTTPKNLKTVFKKYLAFEMAHGTITQQAYVKEKAREYVNSLGS